MQSLREQNVDVVHVANDGRSCVPAGAFTGLRSQMPNRRTVAFDLAIRPNERINAGNAHTLRLAVLSRLHTAISPRNERYP